MVGNPQYRYFTTISTGNNNRMSDAEVKLLEDFAAKYSTTPDVKGWLTLASENKICISCSGVIPQFQKMFPNIKLVIVNGANEWKIDDEIINLRMPKK